MSDKATLQRLLRELIYETSIERRTIILTQIVSLFDAVREEPACEADILRAELAAAWDDADRLAEALRLIAILDPEFPGVAALCVKIAQSALAAHEGKDGEG